MSARTAIPNRPPPLEPSDDGGFVCDGVLRQCCRPWRSSPGSDVELFRNSTLPMREIRAWHFWATSNWDPVAGEFGALRSSGGTAYSIALRPSPRARRSRSESPIYVSRSRPMPSPPAARVSRPSCWRRFHRSSRELWGIFVLVPIVRKLETVISKTPLAKAPDLPRPAVPDRDARGRTDPDDHGGRSFILVRGRRGRSFGPFR